MSLGHNPPEVIEPLIELMQTGIPNLLQVSIGQMAAALGEALASITPGELKRSFLCNSGAEAVEGALKIARIATGKTRIISTEGSFHGKSFGALSSSGREKYKTPFEPLLPGFEFIPFGNTEILEEKLQARDVAAFIVEPIQGEGGVIVPPQGYLKKVRELCSTYDALLIVDEIQTGLARTGKMFAVMWEEVVPDIMTISKSLSGSIMPIGAVISTENVWNKAYGSLEKCLLHTSTFGGNAYACAAALAAIGAIVDMDLPAQAEEKGRYLMGKLKQLQEKYALIKEVRGKGLMIGIEFEQPTGWIGKIAGGLSYEYMAAMVAGVLNSDYRIITAYTLNNPTVIRVQPPLIVSEAQMDYFVASLDKTLSRNSGLLGITMNTIRTFLKR